MLLMTLLALSLSSPAEKLPPKPFVTIASVEGVTEYALPNGFRVLFLVDPANPSVTVNLTVFVGSRHEGYGQKGMAHLFEHMLFKRTEKFASIKEELTKLGGMANGTTWYDRTNYFESFPADDAKVQRAIRLEAQRLRSAIISTKELATEMTVVRNEFEMGENEPMRALEQRAMSAAFSWHNYGDDTIGPRSDIEHVPNAKLLEWYETYYQPDNAMLIIAGRFNRAKAFKAIAETFGKFPKPQRALPSTYTVEPIQDGEKTVTVRRTGGTPAFIVGYHIPSGTHPDYAAISILAHALGESPSGRLYKALVSTKKAASVHCKDYQLREPGYFLCTAQLGSKDSTGPAKETLLATVEGLRDKPLSQTELDNAKASFAKDFDVLFSKSTELAIVMSEFAAMGDWRMLFVLRDRVAAVRKADVMRVYSKYFKRSNRTLGEYIPTSKPDRAVIPPPVDVASMLKDYKGKKAFALGEAFEATPENIDARTSFKTLPSGMKLAFMPKKTRAETVNAILHFNFGDEKSLAHLRTAGKFAARLLLRGTKQRSREEFKNALDRLKAQVGVAFDAQGVSVSIRVHKPELAETLKLVAECLKEPAFDSTEFENLRREIIAHAEKQKDDPRALGQLGLQRMMSSFQRGHPLYVPSWLEIISDARAMKREQIQAYHAKFYGAQAAYAAFVGDFDAKAVTRQLQKRFGGWKGTSNYTRIKVPFSTLKARTQRIETPDKAMAFFGTGLILQMRDDHPDFPTMLLATYMLGGGFLSGRIPQRLREKEGLSYGVGAFIHASSHDERAKFLGYALHAPHNLAKVERGFFDEINRAIKNGFSEKELSLAKEGLLKNRQQARSADGKLAHTLMRHLDLNRTMAFEEKLDARIRTMRIQAVNKVLPKYLNPAQLLVLQAGDFQKTTKMKH